MTRSEAETAINASALVTGGGFLYWNLIRRSEGKAEPAARFIVGWGFTFLALSLLADAQPDLGGWFAILVAVAAILYSGTKVTREITSQVSEQKRGGGRKRQGSHPPTTTPREGRSLA